MFVCATRQDVLHVPESPIPLNSPEFFVKSPFKFNAPLPPGDVVRDIIFDQDRFYTEIVKRFQQRASRDSRSMSSCGEHRRHFYRNNSTLYQLATTKPLRIATLSFINDEMDEGVHQRIVDSEFGCTSFCPSSPNFDSQHSILDLTHVSRMMAVLVAFINGCMGMSCLWREAGICEALERNACTLCLVFNGLLNELPLFFELFLTRSSHCSSN